MRRLADPQFPRDVGGVARDRSRWSPRDVGDLPTVAYNARVVVSLGTSKLVNGRSGGCSGQPPPEWSQIRDGVPESGIGVFEDGGIATQMSNFCGKEVVIRAVRFTGLRPGVEEMRVLGAYMRVEVVYSPAG